MAAWPRRDRAATAFGGAGRSSAGSRYDALPSDVVACSAALPARPDRRRRRRDRATPAAAIVAAYAAAQIGGRGAARAHPVRRPARGPRRRGVRRRHDHRCARRARRPRADQRPRGRRRAARAARVHRWRRGAAARRPRVPHLPRRSATRSPRARASRCTRRRPTTIAPARGTRSACAAIGARLLRFDERATREALGIAEYYGPRGQIMRVCASPTMVKDGSRLGRAAGVTAALLARERLHRRARGDGRGAPTSPSSGTISARAGASSSSTSRPIRCAAGRSRRSKPRSRCSAQHASRADDIAAVAHRELPRGRRARLAMPAAGDHATRRSTASPIRSRLRWFTATSAPRRWPRCRTRA